jgi:curli biogenesis system outer membrane secretion channel CsgG
MHKQCTNSANPLKPLEKFMNTTSPNSNATIKSTATLAKLIAVSAIALASSAAFAQSNADTEKGMTASFPHCDKPIAKVMMGKLKCKAANCDSASAGNSNPLAALLAASGQSNVSGIGDGIKDMMTTALQETGCFEIMDRESMDEINQELAAAGKKVEVAVSDFLISGSVTQIEMEKSSINIGWGLIPVIGSIGKTTQKASVAMDLRLVSVNTAKVLASKNVQASTEDSSFGIGGIGIGSIGGAGVGFAGGFSTLKGTNLEKVARSAVFQATNFLVAEALKAKSNGV